MDDKLVQGKLNNVQVAFKAVTENMPYGTFEAIIANESLDRHGEHMKITGIDTPRKNYKVYYNHSYSGSKDLPIGVIEKLTKKSGQLVGRIKLAVAEYPFAEQIYKLIQGGYLDSMSIGFIPLEWDEGSLTWTKSEFIEGSVVAEPANVEALVTSKGLAQEDADKFVELEKTFADDVKLHSANKVKSITEDLTSLSLTEIKSVLENAKQSIGELEALVNQTPTSTADVKKTLIKVRVAGKTASKQVDALNSTIKIKLKGV